MSAADTWLVVIGAVLATYLWRGLGVLLAASIDPQGGLFRWITCVSYAMVAALVSRMFLLPVGVLEASALWQRLLPLALALAVFFLPGRRLLPALAVGVLGFVLLASISDATAA